MFKQSLDSIKYFYDEIDYWKDHQDLIKEAIKKSNGNNLVALEYIVSCLAHKKIPAEFELVFTIPPNTNATINLPIVECEPKDDVLCSLGYIVKWGDKNITYKEKTHTYESMPITKEYHIRFFGMGISGFGHDDADENPDFGYSDLGYYNPDDVKELEYDSIVEDNKDYYRECLTQVVSFGKLGHNFTSLANAFTMCEKNFSIPDYLPGNIKYMHGMFNFCYTFNQPLDWDFKNVLTTYRMFENCEEFNQPLRMNTSKVEDMTYMFNGCINLNQVLQLDTSNVKNMNGMFMDCENFDQDLNHLDTSKVTNMEYMFLKCENFNQKLKLDTSNVKNMKGMFGRCSNFNQFLELDTKNVTDMSGMFCDCPNFNQDLSNLDVSNVLCMNGMFQYCTDFNQDLSGWDLRNVEDRTGIFDDCGILENNKPKFYDANSR